MKQKIKEWQIYLIALVLAMIALPIFPLFGPIYISPILYYGSELPLAFGIFSILKWG